jgi:hypothetical protein
LEGYPLPGCYANPKTAAEATANIKAVIERMKQKATVPARFFAIEREIICGNGDLIRDLLISLA